DAMIAYIRQIEDKVAGQRLLNGKVVRLNVWFLEVFVDDVVGIAVARGDGSISRNCNRTRCRESIWEYAQYPIAEGGKRKTVRILIGALVLPDGEVKRILIVGEGLITDSEACTDHCSFTDSISDAQSWREVLVVGLAAEVDRIAIDAGNYEPIDGGIVVGIPSRVTRSGR